MIQRYLDSRQIDTILNALPTMTIGVLGDLFLDRYLDIDDQLTEKSIETGLDAFQVVQIRSIPGAAGTILNNLVALGVGRVVPLTILGDDGEGYELTQALQQYSNVDLSGIIKTSNRRTPTYTKPLIHSSGQILKEGNRLDIRTRTPMEVEYQQKIINHLQEKWPFLDGLVVLDQISEENCGVVTSQVRQGLSELTTSKRNQFILADSRERIGLFKNVLIKPNIQECFHSQPENTRGDLDLCLKNLVQLTQNAVFCTCGDQGIRLADSKKGIREISGFPVEGPVDPVGAGDSTSAGIITALGAGATFEQAAEFGCLIASITVQQIGTTGTATPNQVRERWKKFARN